MGAERPALPRLRPRYSHFHLAVTQLVKQRDSTIQAKALTLLFFYFECFYSLADIKCSTLNRIKTCSKSAQFFMWALR
jgi:hypothetical protein